MEYKEIGERIRKARTDKKLTQKELADRVGRTESSVAKYERGLVEIPNSILQIIAKSLDVDLSWLVYGKSIDQELDGWLQQIKEARVPEEFQKDTTGLIYFIVLTLSDESIGIEDKNTYIEALNAVIAGYGRILQYSNNPPQDKQGKINASYKAFGISNMIRDGLSPLDKKVEEVFKFNTDWFDGGVDNAET